jgi:hypothetical protein
MVATLLDEHGDSKQAISTEDENIIKGTAGILYSGRFHGTLPLPTVDYLSSAAQDTVRFQCTLCPFVFFIL